MPDIPDELSEAVPSLSVSIAQEFQEPIVPIVMRIWVMGTKDGGKWICLSQIHLGNLFWIDFREEHGRVVIRKKEQEG